MNWAVVIVGAEVLFSGAYWIYAARHKYMKESSSSVLSEPTGVIEGRAPEMATYIVESEGSKKT